MTTAVLPRVAVIADAHYHDVEGDYGFDGAEVGGRRLAVRSWADTRASTRVFNESALALIHALDEVVARGIRLVVLLGDYSDDGQRRTVASVAELLETYRERHGLRFFALPGNHDAYALHGRHQSKRFLRGDGEAVLVSSDPAAEPDAVVSPAMYCEGYPKALSPMASHGFFRRSTYLHWETPFGPSDDPQGRRYEVVSADGRTRVSLMDASYLVEPEDGLWLLMIDANVFEPENGASDLTREDGFIDSTNAGWNAVLRSKPFLIDWIADVQRRANDLGKALLCFSHYPVVDPFGDNLEAERALFGETNVARRTPGMAVARRLIEAGMSRHYSGHMHVAGDTARDVGGRRLVNVAVPSPVAFPPAFGILDPAVGSMETVDLAGCPLDPRLAALYRREAALAGEAPHAAFDARDLGTFLYEHARALVTHRYFPKEWPPEMAREFVGAGAGDVFQAAGWLALADDFPPECTAEDLVADWYVLRHAQGLALPYILPERLAFYRALSALVPRDEHQTPLGDFLARFLEVLGQSIARADGTSDHRMPRLARAG